MFIEKIIENNLKPEFGILCQRLLAIPYFDRMPFGLTWCLSKPQESTMLFAHHDEEVFLILQGEGIMKVSDKKQKVLAGDVIHIPPFSWHQLTNISQEENLIFLSIHSFFSAQPALPSKVTIFSPPPTPNGNLHLGHLAGPYIASDVLKRYLISRQVQVHHVSGSDDSQTHVSICAFLNNKSREEIVRTYQGSMQKTFEKSSIELDFFISSQDQQLYKDNIKNIFTELLQRKKIFKKTCSLPYCEFCKQYLVEAYSEGKCYQCHDFITGQCCESCGYVTEAHEIIDIKCRLCKQKPSYVEEDVYVLPVENYRQQLEAFFERLNLSQSQEKFIKAMLSEPLKDFLITLPFKEGLHEVDEGTSQGFHPWFEMACRYLFFHTHHSKELNEEIIFFYGFDNSYYYIFLIPAIYHALNQQEYLPSFFISNEFYCLEDKKFSTSRNHMINANDFLDEIESDVLRFYLMMTQPENRPTSFHFKDFLSFTQKIGIEEFEEWIETLNSYLEITKRVITHSCDEWTENQKQFYNYLNITTIEMEKFYHPQHFSPSNAAHKLCDMIRVCKNFLSANICSKDGLSNKESFDLALSLTALKTFALLAFPIAPILGKSILKAFHHSGLWEKEVSIIQSGKFISNINSKPFSYTAKKLFSKKI